MLGLSYVENFTMVHDGRHETEPFMFMYGCGATKQGKYTTGENEPSSRMIGTG
jgi:hypothetical protein